MTYAEAGRLGGLQTNKNFINKYYENPNKCIYCNNILDYKHRHNKFCNRSCAARYNNNSKKKIIIKKYCLYCKKELKRGQKKYCNVFCKNEYKYEQYIKRWKQNLETGLKGEYQLSQYIRKYIILKYNNKCAKCGWSKINPVTKKVPLEIDHIDGNYLNNKENNLILLCPNCHSLTSTYKSLNKGKGRKTRHKYDL